MEFYIWTLEWRLGILSLNIILTLLQLLQAHADVQYIDIEMKVLSVYEILFDLQYKMLTIGVC